MNVILDSLESRVTSARICVQSFRAETMVYVRILMEVSSVNAKKNGLGKLVP